MPRRSAQSAVLATSASSTPRRDNSTFPPSDDPFQAELFVLRRQWKWAAFSQFFYTFATLFAMEDVMLSVRVFASSIGRISHSEAISSCPLFQTTFSNPFRVFQDIEDDLTRSTSIVLPRVMHRLLYTLTQDRKLSYVPLTCWRVVRSHPFMVQSQ